MVMLAFDPNFDPVSLLLIALLNPVVIAVAWIMGVRADQWQKLIVIAFAAALAGAAAVWVATFVGVLPPREMGSDAGLFVFSMIYGFAIAVVAYVRRQHTLSAMRDQDH